MTITTYTDREIKLQKELALEKQLAQLNGEIAAELKADKIRLEEERNTLRQQLAEAQALIKVQMSNVKIPEPIGTICFDGGRWDQNWVSNQDAYSEEQLKQYGDDCAKEALKMAAIEIKVEADYSGSNRRAVLTWAVDKLLALKDSIK